MIITRSLLILIGVIRPALISLLLYISIHLHKDIVVCKQQNSPSGKSQFISLLLGLDESEDATFEIIMLLVMYVSTVECSISTRGEGIQMYM